MIKQPTYRRCLPFDVIRKGDFALLSHFLWMQSSAFYRVPLYSKQAIHFNISDVVNFSPLRVGAFPVYATRLDLDFVLFHRIRAQVHWRECINNGN